MRSADQAAWQDVGAANVAFCRRPVCGVFPVRFVWPRCRLFRQNQNVISRNPGTMKPRNPGNLKAQC
jgi:hypothetical protein